MEHVDSLSFVNTYRAIFQEEIYRTATTESAPYIIDGGANIGLSTLYFKRRFPGATVIAFEPDPAVFAVLERNCRSWGLTDVILRREALWNSDGEVSFLPEGADAGRVAVVEGSGATLRVPSCRLGRVIDQRTHLLKLDIEGAETEVLQDSVDVLRWVDNIFVEYHSFEDRAQTLPELLGILTSAGFRLHLQAPMAAGQPFIERPGYCGMDMQLNVFGFREGPRG